MKHSSHSAQKMDDHHHHHNSGKKYGPPSYVKPRPYNVILELLETQANKKLTHEYHQDVKQWLSTLEANLSVNPSMIDLQPEIQWFMRPFLLDFLIELHSSFKLQPATLFLCFNIIDRYCAKRIVFKRHYQLVGCTALWIAGKYEDKKSRVPTLKELSIMCRNAYDEEMFIQMEMHILSTLEWSLSHPTLEDCLQLSIQSCLSNHLQITPCKYNGNYVSTASNSKISAVTAVARFLCELSLYDRFFLSVPTSLIAITANLLAYSMLQIDSSSKMLENLIRNHFEKKYAPNGQQNDLQFLLTPQSFKKPPQSPHDSDSVYEEFFTDVDSDDEDISNAENKQPFVHASFLSGFDPHTSVAQIRKIGLMLILQLNKITDVLSKKYESLGVIQVVKNFNTRYCFIMSTILDNSQLILSNEDDLNNNSKLNQLADILLQLPQVNEIENQYKQQQKQQLDHLPPPVPFHNSSSTHIPLTPPSATSQYSIFSHSNHTLSSVCATPIQQNVGNGFLQSSDAINGFSPVDTKSFHNPRFNVSTHSITEQNESRNDNMWLSPRMNV